MIFEKTIMPPSLRPECLGYWFGKDIYTYIHIYIYIYIILELKRKRKKHYYLLLTRLIVYLFIYYVLELKIYKFLCSFFIDIVASEKWNR